jgi:hypothetical protein
MAPVPGSCGPVPETNTRPTVVLDTVLLVDDKFPNVFFLKATDPATHSIALEARFEVTDVAELRTLLAMPADELTGPGIYDLEPSCVAKIVNHYGLSFDAGSMPVELHPWHPIDDLPYKVHTGRELALMLKGTKPLAAFCDDYPCLHGLYIIPEREFEPHVTSGLLVKREHIEPARADAPIVKGQRLGLRRVLYALRGEEWRIDAYLLLWKTANKSGWNEGFERMEGTLLGYEEWQIDFHIEQRYRKFKKVDRPK